VKKTVLRCAFALVLGALLLAAAAPAMAKAKPKHPKKPVRKHHPAKKKAVVKPVAAADKAAAAKLVSIADAFLVSGGVAVGAQLPGVQTDWAACSASYPEMSSDQVTELEQVVAEERSLPGIATNWGTAVEAWHGVPTTNVTLKALVALADTEAPELAKLTTLTPLAICDVAATWKAHAYGGQSLADAFEAWIATAGLDETVLATTHAGLAKLVPQLKRLGVDYNGLDTLSIFFF
jgi:hypothetical protein